MLDTLDRDHRTAFQLTELAAGAHASYCLRSNARTALFVDVTAFARSVGEYVQPTTQAFHLLYPRKGSTREQVLGGEPSMSNLLSRSTSPTNSKMRGDI